MIFGREVELAALNEAYERMLGGHGSVLFLTGEAGLGKTTLVHSWWSSLDALSVVRRPLSVVSGTSQESTTPGQRTTDNGQPVTDTLFLESACSIPIGNVDVGRLEALQPWGDVIAQLSDQADPTDPSDQRSKPDRQGKGKLDLKKLLHDSAPAWAWALPIVGDIAHAAFETSRLVREQRQAASRDERREEPGSAAGSQQQVFQQYVNLLTGIAADVPVIIFLDDLHWADTSSCNLLFYLSRQLADKRILVIGTYRQDDAMTANESKGHPIISVKNEILRYKAGDEVSLSYLSRTAIRRYLRDRFPEYVVDDRFERWLEKISDGNALFMSQFVQTLREDGHLNEAGAFVGDYETIEIPKSALAVVEERTRRLDDETRELLTYATVEGEEFTSAVLARITEKKPLELLKDLQRVIAMGLVVERGKARVFGGQATTIYGFTHALFHRALYNLLIDEQKDYLHRQCYDILRAEWERQGPSHERTAMLATKLLAHAERCEEWATVAEASYEKARESWRSFAEDEALEMISRCLHACDRGRGMPVRRAEALQLRGQIASLRGRYADAIADMTSAEEIFRAEGFAARAADAMVGMAGVLYRTAPFDATLREVHRALAAATAAGNARAEGAARNLLGLIARHRGLADEAIAHYSQALERFTAIDDKADQANILTNIGNVHLGRGAYDEAMTCYERSRAIHAATGNRRGEASVLGGIGSVHLKRGAHADALRCYEQGLDIMSAIGDRAGEANTLMDIGLVHEQRNAYADAMGFYERSLAIATAIGNRLGEANAIGSIGNAHRGLGNHAAAYEAYVKSIAIFTAIGNRHGEALARGGAGACARRIGRLEDARAMLTSALDLARALSEASLTAEFTAELGALRSEEARADGAAAASHDAREEARALLATAIGLFRESGDLKKAAYWQAELDRVAREG